MLILVENYEILRLDRKAEHIYKELIELGYFKDYKTGKKLIKEKIE